MKIDSMTKHIEEVLAGSFLVCMIVLVITNVFLRYFTYYSIYWAEEVATICFVWAVFLGASATYKRKLDIGIDFLVKKASVRLQIFIRLITTFFLLALNLYILSISILFTVISVEKPTAVLGISSAVVNSALIVSFSFISWHSLGFFIKGLRQVQKTFDDKGEL